MAESAADYSERLDALWDFEHPAQSEARFTAEAARHPARSREGAEAATQVARAQGLQRRFDDADRTLDGVQAMLGELPVRVRVRYLLERGRRWNSGGDLPPRGRAPHDTLPGAAFYRVDALHMLAIVAPSEQAIAWHRRALAAAEEATDARTRGWRGSLLHNLGWTLHARGDYAAALELWQKALAERDAAHDVARARIARWTVARGLRSLGRLDEAETMQRALMRELDTERAPDGYVFEELAEIAVARGDRAAARPWAAKAYAILGEDAELRANDAARLSRLADLAGEPRAAPR